MTETAETSSGLADLICADAVAQAEAIRSKAVSARELMQEYVTRIDRLDGLLNSYVTVDADRALAAAEDTDRRLAAGVEVGAFEGLAISVKDNVDVAGLPTTHSCEILANNVAANDSPLVRRFRGAGLIPIGKSNIPEFCTDMTTSKLNGTAKNPWDLSLTPGGSSGGAAAALAAGLCAVSHGTDGAGSVRVPAAFCGLVGLKPSRGLLAYGPDEGGFSFGTSTDGVLTRSVRDAAALLDVMAPMGSWTPSRARPYADEIGADPGRLRIGVCTSFIIGEVDAVCIQAVEEGARLLEELGHELGPVQPDWMAVLATAAIPASGANTAALVPVDQAALVEPRNRDQIRRNASLTLLEHHRMVEAVRAGAAEFLKLWDQIDVLLSPAYGTLPPKAAWAKWDDDPVAHRARFASTPNFAQPFNISGQPGMTLPVGWTDAGLPIGIHLAGRKLEEDLLLRLAAQIEMARPWADRQRAVVRSLDAR